MDRFEFEDSLTPFNNNIKNDEKINKLGDDRKNKLRDVVRAFWFQSFMKKKFFEW